MFESSYDDSHGGVGDGSKVGVKKTRQIVLKLQTGFQAENIARRNRRESKVLGSVACFWRYKLTKGFPPGCQNGFKSVEK